MQVVFILIAIGIVVAGGFLVAFIWSVKSGQYEDDYSPAVRILFDNYTEDNPPSEETGKTKGSSNGDEKQEKSES
ncbi:MAG: cbb3-type cytochrome oxidase assembly protein CcoS [Bacteroidales bacterium]